MCGRFTRVSPPEEFAEMFHTHLGKWELGPRYNISPTNRFLRMETRQGEKTTVLHSHESGAAFGLGGFVGALGAARQRAHRLLHNHRYPS